MRLFLLGIILLFCFKIKTKAQNLVPNSSFESHFDCTYAGIENADFWCGVNPVGYHNICITDPVHSIPSQYFSPSYPSYQIPHSGNAYVEFGYLWPTMPSTPSRYPHIKLTDTLKSGKIYCVTYYVSLWNDCKYSADKMGALFTANPFDCTQSNQNLYTGYTPQVVSPSGYLYNDTLNWQEVSGSFAAVGNEAYLTIGNFFPNAAHTFSLSYPSGVRFLADYYLDDVSVEEVFPAKAKNDTLIMQGDSTIIGNNPSEAALFNWQPSSGLSCTNCPNPKASPSVTTTYTVTKTQCKSVTTDVITITVSPTGIEDIGYLNKVVRVYPNPATDVLNIAISTSLDITKELTIKITDVLGKELIVTDYQKQINISQLEKGIYFLSLYHKHQLIETKKIIKE